MLNKPSLIDYNNFNFMIFSAPDDNSCEYWLEVNYKYQIHIIIIAI